MKPRKTARKLPSYVKTPLEKLEPFMAHAGYRRVNDNAFYWRIIWGDVKLESIQLVMLADLVSECSADHLSINMNKQTCFVSIDFYKRGKEDDPNRTDQVR